MNYSYRDVTLALFCAFLGSVKGLLVSNVKSLGPIEIFGIRSVGTTCFLLPLVIYFHYRLWYDTKCNLVLFLRSVIGNVAVCGYYFGFVYLPIAEASMLFYSTPVFTIIIGHLFLGEKCGVTGIISTLLSLAGVALVCVPEFSGEYSNSTLKGIAGSLIGALAQALALAVVRKITHVPPTVVSFWWAVVGILFSSALSTVHEELVPWQCGWEAVYLVFIAVTGFVSELCLVSALKSTDAIVVSIALTSEIIWAFILQSYFSMQMPSLMVILGGVAITVSMCVPPLINIACSKNGDSDIESQKVEHIENHVN